MRRDGRSTPVAERRRPVVQVTLSREALTRLDAVAVARGVPRSWVIEELIATSLPGLGQNNKSQ